MPPPLSAFGQHRATYPVQTFPQVFPRVEQAVRAAFAGRPDVAIRAAQGKRQWDIRAYRGWTAGVRIDFIPNAGAFGPTEVTVEVYRWSRVGDLALLLAVAACFGSLGVLWLANLAGIRNVPPFEATLQSILLGLVAACLGGATSGLLMYVSGRRWKDHELVAVGELVGRVVAQEEKLTPPAQGLPNPAPPPPGPARAG